MKVLNNHTLYHCTAVVIGVERSEYSVVEGTTLSLCVVSAGMFDSTPSIAVTLTSIPGTATGSYTS